MGDAPLLWQLIAYGIPVAAFYLVAKRRRWLQ